MLLRPSDYLYFLIGLDAFLDLPQWKHYRGLLNLVDFIVVSRPGFQIDDILKVIPPGIRRGQNSRLRKGSIRLKHSTLHVMTGVEVPAASREIREAMERGKSVKGLLPPLVEEYVLKEKVYSRQRGELRLR